MFNEMWAPGVDDTKFGRWVHGGVDRFEQAILDPLGEVPVYSVFTGAGRASLGLAGAVYGLAIYLYFESGCFLANALNTVARKQVFADRTLKTLKNNSDTGILWIHNSVIHRIYRGLTETMPLGGTVYSREAEAGSKLKGAEQLASQQKERILLLSAETTELRARLQEAQLQGEAALQELTAFKKQHTTCEQNALSLRETSKKNLELENQARATKESLTRAEAQLRQKTQESTDSGRLLAEQRAETQRLVQAQQAEQLKNQKLLGEKDAQIASLTGQLGGLRTTYDALLKSYREQKAQLDELIEQQEEASHRVVGADREHQSRSKHRTNRNHSTTQ